MTKYLNVLFHLNIKHVLVSDDNFHFNYFAIHFNHFKRNKAKINKLATHTQAHVDTHTVTTGTRTETIKSYKTQNVSYISIN